jgi:hypothetical protein
MVPEEVVQVTPALAGSLATVAVKFVDWERMRPPRTGLMETLMAGGPVTVIVAKSVLLESAAEEAVRITVEAGTVEGAV